MSFLAPTLAVIAFLFFLASKGGRVHTLSLKDCDRKYLEFALRHGLYHDPRRGIQGRLGAHYLLIEKRPHSPSIHGPTKSPRSSFTGSGDEDSITWPTLFENSFFLRFGKPLPFEIRLQPRQVEPLKYLGHHFRLGSLSPDALLAEFSGLVEIIADDPSSIEAALTPELRQLIVKFFLANVGTVNGFHAVIDQVGITCQSDYGYVDTDQFENEVRCMAEIARLLTGLDAGDWPDTLDADVSGLVNGSDRSEPAESPEERDDPEVIAQTRGIVESAAESPDPLRRSEETPAWMRDSAVRPEPIDDKAHSLGTKPSEVVDETEVGADPAARRAD